MPGRLKQRADFLRVAAGRRKSVESGLILQALPRPVEDGPGQCGELRVGFTASKKVGNSVARNRARRRLREAARAVIVAHGTPGQDYVVIARRETLVRPYQALLADLTHALKRLKLYRDGP